MSASGPQISSQPICATLNIVASATSASKGQIAMTTASITLQVDEEAARIYQNASPEVQRKLAALVSLQLLEAAHSTLSLREVMDTIGQHAQERGLTEERLRDILAEIDEAGSVDATDNAEPAP